MIHLLKQVFLFQGLSDKELQQISDKLVHREYRPGYQLFRQGDQADYFYIVNQGSVKLYHEGPDGKTKMITIFKEGDCFGELELIDGEARISSAATMEPTSMYTMEKETFLQLIADYSSVGKRYLRQLVGWIRNTNEQIEDLVFLDAHTRVIKTLVSLAKEHGRRARDLIFIDAKISVRDIANQAGITTELAQKVTQYLQKRGILDYMGDFYYLNATMLTKNNPEVDL